LIIPHQYNIFLDTYVLEMIEMLKILLNIVAILLILGGGVWFLQGINILPGSFMTGQPKWALYGGISILLGIGLLVLSRRKKKL
jgi:LPXTG-motif cell wall-anchored protein